MSEADLENSPSLWVGQLPVPARDGHKYQRGHAVILGARDLTGATRLAAEACSRMGTGLVTVLAPARADVYRAVLPPDIMVSEAGIDQVRQPTALLAGCGGITEQHTKDVVNWSARVLCIVDASGIRDFHSVQGGPMSILTPHQGEFDAAFPHITGTRTQRAAQAAQERGVVIVLKGAETIIASPDKTMVTNRHASAYLAKAGTGDVLAGMIAGLVAQGMSAPLACCAAVWMHGEAGIRVGPGLVAGDILGEIPAILSDLLGS